MASKTQIGTPQPLDDFLLAQYGFNKSMYELGLYLIDEYKAGRCGIEVLNAIIKIFEVQPNTLFRIADDKGANFADGR